MAKIFKHFENAVHLTARSLGYMQLYIATKIQHMVFLWQNVKIGNYIISGTTSPKLGVLYQSAVVTSKVLTSMTMLPCHLIFFYLLCALPI